jgi:N-acetyl-gamma-glutamyl-phosphate reductase
MLRHPRVEIAALFSRSHQGDRFADVFPRFEGRTDLRFRKFSVEEIDGLDAVFLALPHGESAQKVPELFDRVDCIIDLGGDFRFRDPAIYPQWYGFEHPAPSLLAQSVYGLPEWLPEEESDGRLIANPGCYPTAALLGLLPLANAGLVEPDRPMVINALSGVSGAGRKPSLATHFCEVNESVAAYKVGNHQHTPEIEAWLREFSGWANTVSLTTHLLPISRGIFATAFVPLRAGVGQRAIDEAFAAAYRHQPFVRYLGAESPRIADVVHTNFCDIGARYDPRTGGVVVMSAIDNLVKGAAGQAVQNFNRKFRMPQTEGLLNP